MNIERREREIRQEGAIGVDGLLELLPDEVMCDQLFHNNESTGREIEMVVGGPRGRDCWLSMTRKINNIFRMFYWFYGVNTLNEIMIEDVAHRAVERKMLDDDCKSMVID
jgi:hypothetical protein